MRTSYRLRSWRSTSPVLFALLAGLLLLLPGRLRAADDKAPEKAPAGAASAPLADRVPGDAIVYVGWRGAEGLGDGYAGSRLKAVIAASDFKQLGKPFLPQLLKRIEAEDKQAADVARQVLHAADAMWKHPTAFCFGGVDLNAANGQPTPRLALLCDAGNDSEKLAAQLAEAIKHVEANSPQLPAGMIHVERIGSLVAVLAGYDKDSIPAAGAAGKSLSADGDFKSALAQVSPDPAIVAYADFDRLGKQIDDALSKAAPNPQATAGWDRFRDASGFKDLHRVIWTSGFDGKDWLDQIFVDAPAPRKGFLALIDAAPIDDDALKLIPPSSTLVGVGRFDLGKLIDAIHASASAVSPDVGQIIDSVMKSADQRVGFNIKDDLVKSLGDEWVWYVDPRTGGRSVEGAVMVNVLKDAPKAEQSLTALEKFANEQIAAQLQGKKLTVRFEVTQSRHVKIHYLDTPLISPAWAVHDGKLYVGLFPQVVAAAADHAGHLAKSIADNLGFIALKKRLGVEKPTSIEYLDLPQTAPNAYAQWIMISRLTGFADLFGIKSPAMLAPPLDRLLTQLTPAGSVGWADEKGWHGKAIAPFPGSALLSSEPLESYNAAVIPAMISVLLPALNRARMQANRVKSANNLRQIGVAAIMFENEKKRMPNDLGEIFKSEEVTPDVFINPASTTRLPTIEDKDKLADWLNEHSDYVWVGKGVKPTAGAETLLGYEKPEGPNAFEGVEMVFADGHVEFVPREEAQKKIEQAKGQ